MMFIVLELNQLLLAVCTHTTNHDCGHSIPLESNKVIPIDTSRIWSSPYAGMVRLQGGDYSNEGCIEVYCNGQWGTICDDGFGSTDARTICKQLGYNGYSSYDVFRL